MLDAVELMSRTVVAARRGWIDQAAN